MAKCGFCFRPFDSEQGVKSHLKRCDRYHAQKNKKAAALGSVPKGAATTAPVHPNPPSEGPDLRSPLVELTQSMREFSLKQEQPQTLQQKRRHILQAVKAHVIDQYRTPLGQITPAMRGAGKMAIERELAPLPLAEIPFAEVFEFGVAIRDSCYAPEFTRHARQAERQRVEAETRQKKELEALGDLLRADRQKKRFMRLANQQAHARCESKAIRGWDHLVILSDVKASLEEFLTGSESVLEAYAITQKVLEARFIEAEATLGAARAKADAQWREEVTVGLVLGAVIGLVVLSLKYPAQTIALFEWIERTFGYTPGANAGTPNPEAPNTVPPATSAEARPRSRRQRKDPVSPSNPEPLWGNSAGGAPGHA